MCKGRIKGLLFDYGGTLDTKACHWSYILWKGYIKACIPISEMQFREAYVYGERALGRLPIIIQSDTFRDVLSKKVQQEFSYLRESRLWNPSEDEALSKLNIVVVFCYEYASGCIETSCRILQKLQQKYRMALVSNFYGNICSVLRDFGLYSFFEAVIESAVVGKRKPDPAIWKMGIDSLNLRPEEICVIGDSMKKDIIPAKSLGCNVVWLKGKEWDSNNSEEVGQSEINAIGDISQLPMLLDRME